MSPTPQEKNAAPDNNPMMKSEDAKLLRDRLVMSREQSPTSKQQSSAFVSWKQIQNVLGQPFDAQRIPLSKLYQMRFDPMIAFALSFIKVPLVRAPWYIECDDPQVKVFVTKALEDIYSSFIFQYANCLDFGYTAMVKRFQYAKPDWRYFDEESQTEKPVWDSTTVDAITWKPFVSLPPETVTPRWNGEGEFDGIQYDAPANITGFYTNIDERGTRYVDGDHSLWATNERDKVFGSLWGYPRLGYSYRFWWSYWYNWALADQYFEKHADPPPIVYYPNDENSVIDEYGNVTNYRDVAISVGESIRSGSTVAMPSDPVMGFDEKPLNMKKWQIEYLQQPNNFGAFNDRFEYLDVAKLRSMLVPEQSLIEGKGGTSSRNVASQNYDSFMQQQGVLMADIDNVINRYMIPQLIAVNFPDKVHVSCKKITRGFAEQDVDFAKQIIQLIGQQDPTQLKVDIDAVMERLGIQQKTKEQMIKEQEELQKQVNASMPPGNSPAPNITQPIATEQNPNTASDMQANNTPQNKTANNGPDQNADQSASVF
jgi:hypothetical protein